MTAPGRTQSGVCRRARAWPALLALLVGAAPADAQEQPSARATPPAVAAPPAEVPTLDRVQALRPDEEVLDLYTFKNPITVEPNTFDKAYHPGITPEEMALKYGGYVNYGINLGLLQTWKGIKRVTGMRPYEHPAIARPPPLDQAQLRRASEAAGLVPAQAPPP